MAPRERTAGLPLAIFAFVAMGCGERTASSSAAESELFDLPGLGGGDPPSLVVGLTSDLIPGVDFTELTASVSVGGVDEPSRRFDAASGQTSLFPLEIELPQAPEGTALEVTLTARDPLGRAVLVRTARTAARDDRTLLLRVRLEDECSPGPKFDELEACEAPLSCLAGKCQPTFFWPETLEDYAPNWPTPLGHACKPLGAGPAEVAIGQGQDAFEVVSAQGAFALEAGSQGGHHIWLALRTVNLYPEGALTFVDARIDSLGMTLRPAKSPVGYAKADDTCEAVGLRFQLFPDSGAELDVAEVEGETLTLGVTVLDVEGDVGHAELSAPLYVE